MTETLSLLANLILVFVILIYLRQVVRSESTPNPATWLIWLIIVTMNTVSYYHVVSGNIAQWLLTFTSAIGLSAICLYSLFRGKFGRIGIVEIVSFLSAVCVGIFWQTTSNAILTNLFLQSIFLISFVPTITGLKRGQLRERAFPWDLAVSFFPDNSFPRTFDKIVVCDL